MRKHRGARILAACASAIIVFATLPAQGQSKEPESPRPIDLATTLRLANARNLDVQIARERLNAAMANQRSSMEQLVPWFVPGFTWHRRDGLAQASPSGVVAPAAYEATSPGIGLAAQSAVGDAVYNNLAAVQLVHAADEGVAAQSQDVVYQAANAYFELAKAQSLADIARDALTTSEDYQRQLHEAVSIGIAFRGDELRVQAQSEHYRIALRQAIAHRRISAIELARILHLDATADLIPQENELVPLVLYDTATSLETLLASANRARPELKQSEALIAAGRATHRASLYGPLIPSVGAQLFGGRLAGGPDTGHVRSGRMSDYAFALTWRVGPGGLLDYGRINASKAELASRELSDTKLRDVVSSEVVAAFTRIRALGEEIAFADTALSLAAETLRLTRARKEFGVGVVLEDIQAQEALIRARSEYVSAIADFNKAQYALRKAVGGEP